MTAPISRRSFLTISGVTGLLAVVPAGRWAEAMAAAPKAGEDGRFLTATEFDALRAVTDRLLPGPPEDPDPGALQARCAEAIDMLLGAFTFDPPLLYAGGPWSNRAGGKVDYMARFVPPDAFQELGWRIRLEGSQGMADREFAGPVTGLQEQYRTGLAQIETMAKATLTQPASGTGSSTPAKSTGGSVFAALPAATQDKILHTSALTKFVVQVLSDTINAMYGNPEYGGNHDLVGWKATQWPGDVQPRGYTDKQVTDYDPHPRKLPYTTAQIRAVAGQILPGLQIVD